MRFPDWADHENELVKELITLRHQGVRKQRLQPRDLLLLAAHGSKLGFIGEPYEVALALVEDSIGLLPDAEDIEAAYDYFGYSSKTRFWGPQERRTYVAQKWAHQSPTIFRGPAGAERNLLTDLALIIGSRSPISLQPVLDNLGEPLVRRVRLIEEAEARLASNNVLVLYGIPGSGRRSLAKLIANNLHPAAVYTIDCSSTLSFLTDTSRAFSSSSPDYVHAISMGVPELAHRLQEWKSGVSGGTPLFILTDLNDRTVVDYLALVASEAKIIITTDDAAVFPSEYGRVYVGALESAEAIELVSIHGPGLATYEAKDLARALSSHALTLRLACELPYDDTLSPTDIARNYKLSPRSIIGELRPELRYRSIYVYLAQHRAPIGSLRRQLLSVIDCVAPSSLPVPVLRVIMRVLRKHGPRRDSWTDFLTDQAIAALADSGLIEVHGGRVSQHVVVHDALGGFYAELDDVSQEVSLAIFLLGREVLFRSFQLEFIGGPGLFAAKSAVVESELYAFVDQIVFHVRSKAGLRRLVEVQQLAILAQEYVLEHDGFSIDDFIDHTSIFWSSISTSLGQKVWKSRRDPLARLQDNLDDWDGSVWSELIDEAADRLSTGQH